jgi:hypothetical protein
MIDQATRHPVSLLSAKAGAWAMSRKLGVAVVNGICHPRASRPSAKPAAG